ncbi:hypothetical protein GOV12_04875 [Candidatus Pacearchaeota archaeon]|nr:hypothetical protein [Candidatus Pacearchaeota archaeon]
MTNVLLAHHDTSWVCETGRDLSNNRYNVMSVYFEFSPSVDASLNDIASNIRDDEIDVMFVCGQFAYDNRLRESLTNETRGLKESDLPLMVGYLLCPDDLKDYLGVSGLDFGKSDEKFELSPVDITRILTQDPIPATEGLLFNQHKYYEMNGLVLPIGS